MPEREPPSLDELEQSLKSRLSNIEQRKATLQRLQTKEAVSLATATLPEGEGTWEQDVEIIAARRFIKRGVPEIVNHLGSSIATMETRVAETLVAIEKRQEEVLIPQAEEHLADVRLKTKQLAGMYEALQRGEFSGRTYRQRERQFRHLTEEPDRNPDLKKGLELLTARQERERQEQISPTLSVEPAIPGTIEFTPPEEKVLPKLVIDPSKPGEAQIDGKRIKLSAKEEAVLHRLAQTPQENVPNDQIYEIAKQAGAQGKHPGSDVITRLRKKLEKDSKKPSNCGEFRPIPKHPLSSQCSSGIRRRETGIKKTSRSSIGF